MDPVRSALGGGIVAANVLLVALLGTDVLVASTGANPFVFATFTSLCAVGGPPYCDPGSPTATLLTFVWFGLLYVVAWPLLFAGFTWGLPGESGTVHGVVFGFVLWLGYLAVVAYRIGLGGDTLTATLPVLVATLVAYLAYGFVLGGVYDRFASHRTFLSEEAEPASG